MNRAEPPLAGKARAAHPSPHRGRRARFATWLACAAALALLTSCGGDDGDVLVPGTDKHAPSEVRMTWFGVANWTFKIGDLNIMMDGYMTRIPQDYFYGGGGGLAYTKAPWPIDTASVSKIDRVLSAAPGSPVNLLLTGHSHFDHSFDTAYWASLTKATIVGSRTTCYQVQAHGISSDQCKSVYGGETIRLNKYVTMRVVRWNHSGSHELNPEQHDPIELQQVPTPDANGNLKGGVAEDFPNGGGNRGYLFTVKTAHRGTLTFFVTNSGAPQDLTTDNITDGINYGKPIDSLARAMSGARLKGVDVWVGAGGQPVAAITVPVLKPKAYVPNHLGSFFVPFEQANTSPFRDTTLATWLAANNIDLVPPLQYLDAFVLDDAGFRPVDNTPMKRVYGF
jgi:L-ascorbate metabolism protein UlaG (beta-lactamase superfamily)